MDSEEKIINNQYILEAKNYIKPYRPNLVLKELKKIQDISTLNSYELWEFYILKSKGLCKINQYPSALEMAEKALQLAKKSENTPYIIESLVAKGTAEFRMGKNKECFESIQQIKSGISDYPTSSPKEIELLKEQFYMLSSYYHFQTLNKDQFLECNQKRLEICQKYDMKYELGEVYHNLGVSYYMKGELLKSLKYYKQSKDLSKQTKNYNQMAYCLGNIGKIYSTLGELDLALDFYKKSLSILRKIKNKYVLGAFSNAIGTIYIQKSNLEKSMEFFQQGYEIVKKLGNNLNIAGALFKIIENLILQDNIMSAEDYFKELEQIASQDDNRRIQFTYKFALALILKRKGGSRNIVRAGDIIRNLLSIDDLKNDPLLNLKYCELLFEEIAKTNEEEILDEIKRLLDNLDQIANMSRSIDLNAKIKLLQAKFELITLSFDQAQKNFVTGQKIARKFNLTRLERKISQEYDNFLLSYNKWNEMKDKKSILSKRFNLSSIEDILQLTMNYKDIEGIDSSAETSKLLEIVSDNEDSNLKFYPTNTNEKEIILDIKSIQTKFNTESADRIKHENNTIIMNRIGNETVYYVLEGNTYEAQKNLQQFLDEIVVSQKMLESKDLPFNIRKVIEIVNDSDNLIKQKESSKEILEKNDLITAPHRFNILYCLFDNGRMNWTDLKNRLKLTSGNLDYHLSVLQERGWILKDEEYKDRYIQFIEISDYGRAEFKKYIEKITEMCHQVI